jgi:nucleotide-binding universal stress UspA family protein
LWAADECRVRQCTLLIVHAPGTTLIVGAGDPARRALNEFGEELLNEHACAACAREPGVLVTTLLSDGPAAEALIDASRGADLLVVGTRRRGGNLLSILGSDSYRVAAHAHCPVAVVPEQLPPGGVSPRVVVGVSAAGAGRLAFGFALDEAQRRGATLVAVRAWGEPDASLLRALDPAAIDRWKQHAGELLHDDLAPLVQRYPNVKIEPILIASEPADALLHQADDVALIVVGCQHSDHRWSTGLGPVPSAVLHRAPCPVVVVGQRHRERDLQVGSQAEHRQRARTHPESPGGRSPAREVHCQSGLGHCERPALRQ